VNKRLYRQRIKRRHRQLLAELEGSVRRGVPVNDDLLRQLRKEFGDDKAD